MVRRAVPPLQVAAAMGQLRARPAACRYACRNLRAAAAISPGSAAALAASGGALPAAARSAPAVAFPRTAVKPPAHAPRQASAITQAAAAGASHANALQSPSLTNAAIPFAHERRA